MSGIASRALSFLKENQILFGNAYRFSSLLLLIILIFRVEAAIDASISAEDAAESAESAAEQAKELAERAASAAEDAESAAQNAEISCESRSR